MATILDFRLGSKLNAGRGKGNVPCEIVLFPGVRYEYHSAPSAAAVAAAAAAGSSASKAKTRKAVRKRDKLELKD